jgi:nitroreductase
MKLHDLLEKRYSPRAFNPEKVPSKEEIELLFKAAQWAPSSYNDQPWRFMYALNTDKKQFEKLMEPLVDFNKEWVKMAPLLVLTMARKHYDNGKPHEHSHHDLGLAMGQMCIQASAMGMYMHHMSGFDPNIARELFNVPDELDIVTYVAIGFLGDKNNLPDYIAKMEDKVKTRKDFDELIFKGDWEKLL